MHRPHSTLSQSGYEQAERISLLLIILAAAALRFYTIGAKGLAYDEAATALMSRAQPWAIVQFHWDAAFEHLPGWILIMHRWSQLAGQSETALRMLPSFAGIALIPAVWVFLKSLTADNILWRAITALLIVFSPSLIFYSQEARMYTSVVLLGVLSVYLITRAVAQNRYGLLGVFVLVNWLMISLHYYSLLLIGAEALYYTAWVFLSKPSSHPKWNALALALVLSVAPVALWMFAAPGFRETVEVVLRVAGQSQRTWYQFFAKLWRDLSFGAIRWQPASADVGFVLVPLLLVGMIDMLRRRPQGQTADNSGLHWGWLLVVIILLPLVVSVARFRTLSARYILYIMPFLYAVVALAVLRLWAAFRLLGFTAILALVALTFLALSFYYGPYHKSEYREMAKYLSTRAVPESDVILLEAPRQHLLAKYYLDDRLTVAPVPSIDLPLYWPVTAPHIVPGDVDKQVGSYLETKNSIWVVFTAEDEVDPGEFLAKYLAAVAIKHDCERWLDVRVCRFLSPESVVPAITSPVQRLYADELRLESAALTPWQEERDGDIQRALLVSLDWHAESRPTVDYKVSLRLVDTSGNIRTQIDEYPIGPLLPPSTWSPGDRKPGYLSLSLPADLPAGEYSVRLALYDPSTLAPVAHSAPSERAAIAEEIELASLHLGDRMVLFPARPAESR